MTRKQLRSIIKSELRRWHIDGEFTDEELNDRLNIAKDELSDDVGGFPGYAYGTTTSGVSRYQLPSQLMSYDRVEFNGKQLDRVRTDAIEAFSIPGAGSISWTVTNDTAYDNS